MVHRAVERRPSPRYDAHNPYATRIVRMASVAAATELIELDVEGVELDHHAADDLCICPQNDPEAVRRVLHALDVRGQQLVSTPRGSEPAWRALLEQYDLGRVTPGLARLLAEHARLRDEARHLLDLARGAEPLVFDVPNLLRRFPSARPPLAEVLDQLARLEPSAYPIASSREAEPDRLAFCTRVPTAEGEHGFGVASEFVRARLRIGEWLSVYTRPSERLALPDDELCPLVFIVDALGLARARACVRERAHRRSLSRTWVIPCLPLEPDCAAELEAWRTNGTLTRYSPCDALPTAAEERARGILGPIADPLWRWIVDSSAVVISVADRDLSDALERELGSTLALRRRMPAEAAPAQLEALLAAGRLIVER
jgi:sulfite reductase (NADPH) flavoprotein alpha-component